jgi:hypothetical protein
VGIDRKDPGFDKEVTAAESPSARMKRPPLPVKKPRLMDHSERLKAYGAPATLWNGKLAPDVAWERKNIVAIMVPWDGGQTKAMRVHRATVDKWQKLFARIRDAGLLPRLKTFGGAFNCRMKRGHENSTNLAHLSTHAFGAAADFNVLWNPLGAQPAPLGQPGSMLELVPLMNEQGFVWGGDFSRIDAMHCEVGV